MSAKSKPELEYLAPSRLPKPIENIEAKKAGYLTPSEQEILKQQPEQLTALENNFYDEINNNKQRTWDKLKKIVKYNPFVPVGMLITVGVLFNGIQAMRKNDREKSQRMMRYRVGAQGGTIIALVIGTLASQYFANRSN